MKKYIIILCFTCLSLVAIGQSINVGIKAGPSIVNIVGKDTRLIEFKPSYHVGAILQYPLTEKLSFQPEVLFDAQGGVGDIGSLKAVYNFNYIQMPLNFSYNFFDNFRLEFGPRVGYNLIAKINWAD